MEEHPLHALGFAPLAPTLTELRPARQPATPPPAANDHIAKGGKVRLPDGSVGTVAWIDPNLRIVRVRTDQGRKLTVRRNQLRLLKP